MAEEVISVVKKFDEFFEAKYRDRIEKLALEYPEKRSLDVDFRDLEKYDYELADELVRKPDAVAPAAREAVSGMMVAREASEFKPHVRFFNLPDSVLVQDVGSANIDRLICIEGVITKRAEVRPRVKIAVYKCARCDAVQKFEVTKNMRPPDVCESCKRRALSLVEEDSYFVDLQKAEVQELLERLRGGAPASHIELWLEDDLVNMIIPGDNVEITGVLRIRPPIKGKGDAYSKYIDVMHVERVQREFEEVEISRQDEEAIMELSKTKDIFERIVASMAPSIYGHTEIKAGVALQLFGGTSDKELPEGGRIRSDIHILLIGDPGAAKTRILQYVVELAPKSIYVSGKSVTGAGLTAAAERDELSEGGWTLKAGALVLASGGMAAVDEFDKIDENERAAMHEVMESQTVSVAKAGIVAKFKAKTSILAAANPKFGRFDPNQLPAEQFNIPPTLLSRFDLIFPVRDVMDEEKDRKLADYILNTHEAATRKGTPPATDVAIIQKDLLRKYIAYARKNVRPRLTPVAMDKIKEYYVEMRKLGASQGTVAITPRYIEGLIRLSEGSAKARLSELVELEDSDRAIRLTDFVMRQIMTDRETNRIDIDIIATGQPKSRVEKVNMLLNVVKELQKEFDLVEISKVVEGVKEYDMDEMTARRLIDDLLTKGDLFKPKPGFIKIVRQYE
ncbi:MAG: minichromosome maintenance protein MCM [Candidatus Micrarchaeota archaeon]|nr:minichromosome maintenance protein MCM [Candidatus Micrarchaeota archaeon]